jgi:hypothetical protein
MEYLMKLERYSSISDVISDYYGKTVHLPVYDKKIIDKLADKVDSILNSHKIQILEELSCALDGFLEDNKKIITSIS